MSVEAMKQAPVHASDMPKKHVHISDKDRHEWVGLTVDEIDKFMPYCHTNQDLADFRDFARSIEAKLREKNNAA